MQVSRPAFQNSGNEYLQFDREGFSSPTESTISPSLIHHIASERKREQELTWVLNLIFQHENVRGLFSAKVPNSSFAEVRMGLLIEPIHLEDEDEAQENEEEDERDGEECRVEGRREVRHTGA